MSKTISRLPEVVQNTGLSRSTIYLRMSKGDFPQSISLGGRAIGWIQEVVNQWIEERISASRSTGGQHDQ